MKTKSSALAVRVIAKAVLVAVSISSAAFAQPAPQKPATPAPAAQTGPKKANIAVINLKSSSGVTSSEADLISDRLRGDLFNTGKVNVMERDQMQEILKEQGFQQSGACTNEACMVEMGQLLGVEQLITGSLGKVGSMFLVNLRIIDVKTAKITKVVSKDVKGSIEDVVGELGPIAAELVGGAAAPAVVTVEKKNEEKPAEPEQPKPETISEPAKEEKPVAAVEPAPDERAEKNKNRAGIRMAFNFFGSGLVAKSHYTMYNPDGTSQTEVFTAPDSEYNFSMFFNPQLKFFFKAGPVLTIDVGPSYTFGSMESKNGYDESYGNYLNVFGVAVGVNFVKRWYPVKLNIGLMVDFNYLLNMEEFKYSSIYYTGSSDSVAFHNSANVSYGMRAGAEIMAGKHVGFNVDFLFQYSYFETESSETTFSTGGSEKWYFSYLLPMFGLGLGVNFYY
jgi:curli biogenesis system outer membrane secretion channel CsgG